MGVVDMILVITDINLMTREGVDKGNSTSN